MKTWALFILLALSILPALADDDSDAPQISDAPLALIGVVRKVLPEGLLVNVLDPSQLNLVDNSSPQMGLYPGGLTLVRGIVTPSPTGSRIAITVAPQGEPYLVLSPNAYPQQVTTCKVLEEQLRVRVAVNWDPSDRLALAVTLGPTTTTTTNGTAPAQNGMNLPPPPVKHEFDPGEMDHDVTSPHN